MRVALVSARNRQATGVDRYAHEIERALRGIGVDAVARPLARRELKLGGVRVGGFASLYLQRLRGAPGGVDLVHVLDPAAASRGADVVTIHDLLQEAHPELYLTSGRARLDHRLNRALARHARWFVCVSEATRGEAIRRWGIPPERAIVSHHGIDHERFRPVDAPSRFVEDGKPTLVYVGDDNPRKNVLLAVRAAAELRARHGIAARLVRVGPSRFPAVQAAYRAAAAEGGVDLVEPGYLEDAELVPLLSRAAAFVWPSLGEGFGFPPLEAMACGAPVVALDTPVNREVCGAAARYHTDDAGACADALAAVLRAPPPREEALAHARTFTWGASARRHLAVYEKAREARG